MRHKEKQKGNEKKSLVSKSFRSMHFGGTTEEERERHLLKLKRKMLRGGGPPGCTWSSGQSSVGGRAGVHGLDWAREARGTESKRDKSRR